MIFFCLVNIILIYSELDRIYTYALENTRRNHYLRRSNVKEDVINKNLEDSTVLDNIIGNYNHYYGSDRHSNSASIVEDHHHMQDTMAATSEGGGGAPCKPSNETDRGFQYLSPVEKLPSVTDGKSQICGVNHKIFHPKHENKRSYPCKNVDMESFVSLSDLGESYEANDIWGWYDTENDVEYAIIGLSSGSTFVSLEDPTQPKVMGKLNSHTSNSVWRDIKTYKNYAYIVSEAFHHGLQIFDMSQLHSLQQPSPSSYSSSSSSTSGYSAMYTSVTQLEETAHHGSFSNAHNLFINEDSSTAYIVGSNRCSGGLYMLDISNPLVPVYAGCHRGYTHDVQCVTYDERGPDTSFHGKEICFAYKENRVEIIDVTNKRFPILISTFTYFGVKYTHQGWLSDDWKHIFINDEVDEMSGISARTRTIICDVSDLRKPKFAGNYYGKASAIDHNLYVKNNFLYQANYRSGLRIVDLNRGIGSMEEVAFFDIFPMSDSNQFNGAWSTYAFFDSGLVVVSGIEQGLYVLRPSLQNITYDEDEDGGGCVDWMVAKNYTEYGDTRQLMWERGNRFLSFLGKLIQG